MGFKSEDQRRGFFGNLRNSMFVFIKYEREHAKDQINQLNKIFKSVKRVYKKI